MNEQSFLDKLGELRTLMCGEMPTPQLAAMARGTALLRRSGIVHKCLQRGETAPDFHFSDDQGQSQSLYKLLENGPVAINFFRGFWCKFCNTELDALASVQAELKALGAQYLAISPQKPSAKTKNMGKYPIVFDKNNQIASKFKIVYGLSQDEIELFRSWDLRLDELNGSGDWSLPLPVSYVIATDRRVAFLFADVDFRSRCCPDELLEAVRQLP